MVANINVIAADALSLAHIYPSLEAVYRKAVINMLKEHTHTKLILNCQKLSVTLNIGANNVF